MHEYTNKRSAGNSQANKHYDWCHSKKYEYPENSKYLIDNRGRIWSVWDDGIQSIDKPKKYIDKSSQVHGCTPTGVLHPEFSKTTVHQPQTKYGYKNSHAFGARRSKLLFPGTKGSKALLSDAVHW